MSEYLIRRIKSSKIADFSNNYCTHAIVYVRDRKYWRIALIHDGFDFSFNLINFSSYFLNELYGMFQLQRFCWHIRADITSGRFAKKNGGIIAIVPLRGNG